ERAGGRVKGGPALDRFNPGPLAPPPREIGPWRGAEHPCEHGGEGGDAVIAEVERYAGHRLAVGEARHRREQARLLPPDRQAETGCLPESAGEGPPAHGKALCPVLDRQMR